MHRYAIEIFYSEEDNGYIAVAPELPECSAFGETEEEALKEIKIAIDLWLETSPESLSALKTINILEGGNIEKYEQGKDSKSVGRSL